MPRGSSWVYVALSLSACGGGVELRAQTYEALLDEAIEEGLPGVILLVDKPGEADDYLAARGLADRDAGLAMAVDARFRVASNTKSFVGLAAAQLQVDGILDLDQPAATWLSADVVARIDNAELATVRELLDHTGGTFDYLANDAFEAAVNDDPERVWTINDALIYAYDEPAYFAPGEGWEYSNTNYLLVGLVIEAATGQPWGEVVHERVLEPLALADSFIEGTGAPTGPIVHGYSNADGGYRDMFAIDTGYGLPDGGLVTTAADLGRYIRSLATRAEPLSEASVVATSQLVETGDDDKYGLGVSYFEQLAGSSAWGHGGNLEGYSSEMFYFPAGDVTVVLLVNGSDGDLDLVFEAVVERALELALGDDAG